eukprot:2436066-Prymnesium_polylepis.1
MRRLAAGCTTKYGRGAGQYSDEGVGGVPYHARPFRTTRYIATTPWRWRTIRASDMGGGLSTRRAYVVQDVQGRVKPVILPATMRSSGGVPLSAPLPLFQSLREDRRWLVHQGRQPRDRL